MNPKARLLKAGSLPGVANRLLAVDNSLEEMVRSPKVDSLRKVAARLLKTDSLLKAVHHHLKAEASLLKNVDNLLNAGRPLENT